MAKIAYVLLAHRDPGALIRQARRLTAAGDCVALHYDARAPRAEYEALRAALAGQPNITFARRRIRCGWGQWSLVRASLETLRVARDVFPRATHFFLISGDCMPVKSAEFIHDSLDRMPCDHIESHDFFRTDWIKTGWTEDRLIYRHIFNERRQRRLFYAMHAVQKHLGLRRALPDGLAIHIGSQWWCLRAATVDMIFEFLRANPAVARFFRTTWIPDEILFQTLVRHLVPRGEIRNRTPTFLIFSDYGMPVTFYNDHYDMLLAQDAFFARKISPEATDLKSRLGALYAQEGQTFAISDEGRAQYAFLTAEGREGRRFAPRFWEAESRIGRHRQLLILSCSKWSVARRLAARIQAETGIRAVGYLFNDPHEDLPELRDMPGGAIRHRRVLMRMLYDAIGADRLAICVDPSSIDIIQDFFRDQADTRLLEIQCTRDDADLTEQARRQGLIGAHTGAARCAEVVATLRNQLAHHSERLATAHLAPHHHLEETAPEAANLRALRGFLGISDQSAVAILTPGGLFDG
ncbi:MAG: beta-1,6-N-acetylglucosaminyltransferase [Rhodobacteraceae bacterium]|nr:beta-1,6-N-acetylglucosaminyltransferase [Paracoccaceae bacterium]